MTSFARHSCHARPNASIEHQTASDPCTEGEYRQVFNIFPGSKPFFTKGSYVGVVFHDYTGPETLFNLVFDRGSRPPRQIGRFAHYSGLAVDDARDPDSHTQQGRLRLVPRRQSADSVAHILNNTGSASGDASAECHFFEERSVFIDRRNAKVCTAKIDSDGKVWHENLEYHPHREHPIFFVTSGTSGNNGCCGLR